MRRALLIVCVLLAGCGEEQKADKPPAKPVTLKATGDHLAQTLRASATVLDRQSCGDEDQIRTLSAKVTSDIRLLGRWDDRPEVADGITQATEVRDGLEELLVRC